MKKKLLGIGIVAALSALLLGGCGEKKNDLTIRYLNFKPEVADVWSEIAATYEAETGVKVEILNSPSNCNEQTLKSEIAKKNTPTLFQINGPVGYNTWKNYCRDLSDTELYSWVVDKDMVITGEGGNGVYGIPYVVEGYGIIYNNAIMQKYFSSSQKGTSYSSMEEINSFDKLKEVADDMQKNKDSLGIKGVFASTSFSTGEEWRWQTHLLNLPIYYEYKDDGVNDKNDLTFKYADQYKNILDLYLTDSITERNNLGNVTVNDSMAEFAKGECVMVQNGNWAWSQISETEGNIVNEDDCKFFPIYIGAPEEENQGLCIGTECYMSVNNLATEEEQQAGIAFLEWLFSSPTGKDYVTNKLQFITVFNTFSEDETPSNPLAKEVSAYLKDESKTSVSWNFTTFPSQEFKDGVSQNLYRYIKGEKPFEVIPKFIVEDWGKEKNPSQKEQE